MPVEIVMKVLSRDKKLGPPMGIRLN